MRIVFRMLVLGVDGTIYRVGLDALSRLTNNSQLRIPMFADCHIRYAQITLEEKYDGSMRLLEGAYGMLIFGPEGAIDTEAMQKSLDVRLRLFSTLSPADPSFAETHCWEPSPQLEMDLSRIALGYARAKVLRIEEVPADRESQSRCA
jgi:hypothetical protein